MNIKLVLNLKNELRTFFVMRHCGTAGTDLGQVCAYNGVTKM